MSHTAPPVPRDWRHWFFPPQYAAIQGRALQVATGKNHVCARLADGSVSCWGQNEKGQLGAGTIAKTIVQRNVLSGGVTVRPEPRWGDASHRVVVGAVNLAAHGNRTCAVTNAGGIECWGDLRGHSFEDPPRGCAMCDCPRPLPVRVVGIGEAVAVVLGAEHACALLRDETVACWGDNRFGQLGLGHARPIERVRRANETLAPVVGLRRVKSLAASDYSTCALVADGSVRCWGLGQAGELGTRSGERCRDTGLALECATRPLRVPKLQRVVELASAPHHACARTGAGRVFCWGANDFAQLGWRGTDTCTPAKYQSCLTRYVPAMPTWCARAAREVALPGAARRLILAPTASCALLDAPKLSCWATRGMGMPQWLGLVGNPWDIETFTMGVGFQTVLSDGGLLHAFRYRHRYRLFSPLVVPPLDDWRWAEEVVEIPAPSARCALRQKRVASCPTQSLPPTVDEVLARKRALVGRWVRVLGTLSVEPREVIEGTPNCPEPQVVGGGRGYVVLRLRGGRNPKCDGMSCCDIAVPDGGRSVVASGVLQLADSTASAAHLADARLCAVE
jgi:hypothetical protein